LSPQAHLAKARPALASAKLLLASGDVDGACNRAYYAMFDAARAVSTNRQVTQFGYYQSQYGYQIRST
jgi:uncharacterized protein (UPF0332 family)